MAGELVEQDLFVSGTDGYHTYRIPALEVTARGPLLAFCEGRKHSRADAGEIDLLLRRSTDGGATWGETQVVVTDPGMTCGNPAPVLDRHTGTIWLPFCKNECRTWNAGRVLWAGRAAYSDLAVTSDLAAYCLYERGQESPYERLTLAALTWRG